MIFKALGWWLAWQVGLFLLCGVWVTFRQSVRRIDSVRVLYWLQFWLSLAVVVATALIRGPW